MSNTSGNTSGNIKLNNNPKNEDVIDLFNNSVLKNSYKVFNYKTINTPSLEVLYKDKGSKFYGYAIPIETDQEVKKALEELKQKHSSAGHFCYAYQHGLETIYYRVCDDGEPNNSAGLPIYGQLQAFEVPGTAPGGVFFSN